jgi:hypothetical protein
MEQAIHGYDSVDVCPVQTFRSLTKNNDSNRNNELIC